MIAFTRDGLIPAEDWHGQQVQVLAIANAHGYPGLSSAGAMSYLLALDPPLSDDDAVVWSWSDVPVRSEHVNLVTGERSPRPVSLVKVRAS